MKASDKVRCAIVMAALVFSAQVWAHPVKGKSQTHNKVSVINDQSKIDSNAYNFKNIVSNSVSPQTGQLSTRVTLGHLSAHQLAPNFTLTADYSQGNQSNQFALGNGWALNLTHFNGGTNTLQLANGSSYKATPGGGACIYALPKGATLPNVASCIPQTFQYHKLRDVMLNVYHDSSGVFSGAQVIYKDGHREILDNVGRLIQIIYPRGYSISLNYTGASPTASLPSNIQDSFGNTITFKEDGLTHITSQVDGKSHEVTVQVGAGMNLMSVTEGDTATGQYVTNFSYQQQGTSYLLQKIVYPSGASAVITYNGGQGLAGGLPMKTTTGQTSYFPVVTQIVMTSSTPHENPTTMTYFYGTHNNYTGYPQYEASPTEDTLLGINGNFLYQTTETISRGYNDANASVERITRTYEHHHYLMEQKVELYNKGTGNTSPVKDMLYSYCDGVTPGPVGATGQYPGQQCIISTPGTLPVTSGLPAAVRTITYDAAGKQRVTQTLKQYDDSGNMTGTIACSDTDITNNTCLFGKTTSSIVNNTQYAEPLVSGGITNTVASTSIVTPFDGTRTTTNTLQTLSGIDGLSYQKPQVEAGSFTAPGQSKAVPLTSTTNVWSNGYISNSTLAFPAGSPLDNYGSSHVKQVAAAYTNKTDATAHTFTVTKTIGTLSSSKTYDGASGLLVSEKNQTGHVTQYDYDSLGRKTAVTTFADTSTPIKKTYTYQLPANGIAKMIETDPQSATQSKPYQKETVFDGVGKPIQQFDNMNATGDPTGSGPTTELSSKLYGPTGKVVAQTEGDITSVTDQAKASYYFYNPQGQKIATLYPNGTFSVTIANAPNNLTMSYLAGIPKGKQGWVFNGFKVQQKVPRTSALFTKSAKNPSDIVLNTYILPANPNAKNAQGQPVYSGAVQSQLSALEAKIGPVLAQLSQEKANALAGYAMKSEVLDSLNAQLAAWAVQAIQAKMTYSSSDAVYDGFADEISKKDVNGNTTTMQYDDVGNQISITDPAGHVTHVHYNILNKPICLALGSTASATDACVAALNLSKGK